MGDDQGAARRGYGPERYGKGKGGQTDPQIGLAHDGVNRHDKKLVEQTLESVPIGWPIPDLPAGAGAGCPDKGYHYDDIRRLAVRQRFERHMRTRGEGLAEKIRDPKWRARRWSSKRVTPARTATDALLIRWSRNPGTTSHFSNGPAA
jgi:hypothetical protein